MRDPEPGDPGFAWAAALAICGLGAAIYAPALDAPFYYDDYQNIVDNPAIRWTELRAPALLSTAFDGPTLRPVANLSFASSYYLAGPDPRAFRLANLGIHLANALLVALFANAVLRRLPRPPPARDARWLALLSGLVFAAHPLQIQSVTYVVQRMNALATCFYLAALLAWWRGRERSGGARLAWWCAAVGAGLLALGAKEIAVTLPLALWLCEWFCFRDLDPSFARRSALRAGLPLLLAAAAVYAAIFHDAGWGYAGRDFSAGERLLTELRVVCFYASLVLLPLPSRLNLLHDFPLSRSLLDPLTTLASAAALLLLVALAVRQARRRPLLSFAIAWFLLQLILESALLPLALIYEHRTYLPLVGVAVAAPGLLLAASGGRAARALPIGFAVVALLGVATLLRNRVWADELRFWSDVAAKSPRHAGARTNLGTALLRAGRAEQAAAAYRSALELAPDDPELHSNLGSAVLAEAGPEAALPHFRDALALAPGHFRARHNLALALAATGRVAEAREQLELALSAAPTEASLWNGLGAVLLSEGRPAEAAAAFRRALALDPAHADAARNLEVARRQLGVAAPE